jgi:hypothetical protein
MARALLIASLLATAACYDPTFDDCTTTCSTSDLCPDGLTCTAGYCRTAGATDSCEGHMTSCPQAPPMQCMNTAHAKLQPPNCFAVCEVGGDATAARAFTVNTWHLAVLDDAMKQAGARTAAADATLWIALQQTAAQTVPGAGWEWKRDAQTTPLGVADWAANQPDDADGNENAEEDCGAITQAGWIDDACTASHAFLIAP